MELHATTSDLLAAIWVIAAAMMLGFLGGGAYLRWRRDGRLGSAWIECPGCGALVRLEEHHCEACGAEIAIPGGAPVA